MKAILLAAGRGSRLKPYTDQTPKSLLPIGKTTLIYRTVHILHQLEITDISIVVGYHKEKFFKAFPSGIKFYLNENYLDTDQAGSLFQARKELNDDLLIIAADLFCPAKVFGDIIQNRSPICLAIDKKRFFFNDTIEKIFLKDGKILQIGKTTVPNDIANAEFLGITRLNRKKCPQFLKKLGDFLKSDLKTQILHLLQQFIDEGEEIDYVNCSQQWYEIDNLATLKKARELFDANVYRE